MAFTVKLYNNIKKHNSTRQPLENVGTVYDCVLLDNCNITNPAIKLHFPNNAEALQAIKNNYCYIPDFNRYYFVTEWEADKNCWVAHCTVDVLASYKSEIGASEQYILRSFSEANENIADTLYPTTGDIVIKSREKAFLSLVADYSSGCYVLGVLNSSKKGVGSVCHYLVDNAGLRTLLWALFQTTDWLDLGAGEISGQLVKALVNPLQYVVSCKLIPAFKSIAEDSFEKPEYIEFGWWKTENEIDARIIPANSTILEEEQRINVDKHPQSYTDDGTNLYLCLAPYSRYSIELPFYGRFTIDPAYIKNCTNMIVKVKIDVTTGDCLYILQSSEGNGDRNEIARLSTNVGIDVKIAQLATDILGLGTSGITTITSAVSTAMGLDVGGAVTSAVNGIESTVKTAIPQLSMIGGVGSVLQCNLNVLLIGEFYKIVDTDVANLGKPLCKRRRINYLNGYIKCADAHIGLSSATAGEVDRVRDLMNEGFFYE